MVSIATCTQDSLRLTGGFVSTEGTLEVCDDGAWNSICADEFQRQDGFVACRELGYPATGINDNLLFKRRFRPYCFCSYSSYY